MSKAFEEFAKIAATMREIKEVNLPNFPTVWIRTLKAKEVEECSPYMEYVDGKPVLQQRQSNARRIFYSLCFADGKPFIKTEGEKDLQEALNVIESWPSAVVNALLKEIDSLNPYSLTEEEEELGKSIEADGD